MVILAGIGAANNAFDNFAVFFKLLPQDDVYDTRTLSPVPAPALLVNVTVITCEFTSPESINALLPNVPVNDQNQPVGAAKVAVADGTVDGAAYLYFLAPHTFVSIAVIVSDVGATGTAVATFVNLAFAFAPLPHAEVYRNLTLSPTPPARLLV